MYGKKPHCGHGAKGPATAADTRVVAHPITKNRRGPGGSAPGRASQGAKYPPAAAGETPLSSQSAIRRWRNLPRLPCSRNGPGSVPAGRLPGPFPRTQTPIERRTAPWNRRSHRPRQKPTGTTSCVERNWIYFLLIGVAGFLGAFTYVLRGNVFCNAQTSNIVLMGMAFGQGNWRHGLYYLIPITAYTLGRVSSRSCCPTPSNDICPCGGIRC